MRGSWIIVPPVKPPDGGDPADAGVPVMKPDESSFNPAGRMPEATDQEYGVVPPAAMICVEYGTPMEAGGSLVVVIRRPVCPSIRSKGATRRIAKRETLIENILF